jgi:hypothetical protein
LPDQPIPAHVCATMIRPRLGYRLLFSYGPDMDPDIIAQQIPTPTFITVAHVPSRQFRINADGVAGLWPRKDFAIHGVVWMIDEIDLACLDLKLAVPRDYDRFGCMGRDPHGKPILMEYHAPRNQRPGRASADYLKPILAAGASWGLPEDYLKQISAWRA